MKTYREFKIFVRQYQGRSEEEAQLEELGIKSSSGKEDLSDYHPVRITIALEDVVEYFESYNSAKKTAGVAIQLNSGASYFIIVTYDRFKRLRIEAGIEKDPAHKYESETKSTESVEETF